MNALASTVTGIPVVGNC